MATQPHTQVPHEHADAWHHHAREEGLPQHEHAAVINVKGLFFWFIGCCAFVVAFILVTVMFFHAYYGRMQYDFVETTASSKPFRDARFNAEKELGINGQPGEFAWIDHDRVRIPIDLAMQKVVAQYAEAKYQK